MVVYTCDCGFEYDSERFSEWNRKPHEEVLAETPKGQAPQPPDYPKSWAYGKCGNCGGIIRRKEG